MPASPLPIRVTPVDRKSEAEALALLFRHLPASDRQDQIAALKDAAACGEFSFDNLWVAECRDKLAGVLLQIHSPGRIAYVWEPVVAFDLTESEQDAVADAMLQQAGRSSDVADIQFSQVLLAEGQLEPAPVLGRNGYTLRSTLLLQERNLVKNLPASISPELSFEPVNRPGSDRLADLLKATYSGTQDCPNVTRLRSGTDALARHTAACSASYRRWFLLRSEGRDVGVLFLIEERKKKTCEIDYFGVIPEARGRGYGRAAILRGLDYARQRGALRMATLVDSDNHYACRTYTECGFQVVGRHAVAIRLHPELVATGLNTFSTKKS